MYFKTIISICALIASIDCQLSSIPTPNPTYNRDLISLNNGLALDLLKRLPTTGNNFFSPLSITMALLMVMNGANGTTQQEFRQFFKLDQKANLQDMNSQAKSLLLSVLYNQDDKVVTKLANLLLVQNDFPVNEEYKEIVQQMFNSDIESVDFHNNSQLIVEDINHWVSQQTNNKIPKLIEESLPEDTPMVLLNAIYFKGFWKYLFDRKDTKKDQFLNFGKTETTVDMMSMKRDLTVKRVKSLSASVFEMPFAEGSDMSMVVILPDQLTGIDSVTQKLSLKELNDSAQRAKKRLLRSRAVSQSLYFPKFKLESRYELKEYLKNLGLKSIFDDSADFSGVNGQHNLKVSKTIHKAFIEVNEEGAEAAATTAAVYSLRSFPTETRVDRPFLFAIIDKRTSLIWFIAQIRTLS